MLLPADAAWTWGYRHCPKLVKNQLTRIAVPRFTMASTIEEKLKSYRTAPFDARFPNSNQTRNCFQNYLDFHRCEKALTAKGSDPLPCAWFKRVYTSLCPIAWVNKWDEQRADGKFPGRI
ncbi:unnamed protein product [Lampetra fluviatilis]